MYDLVVTVSSRITPLSTPVTHAKGILSSTFELALIGWTYVNLFLVTLNHLAVLAVFRTINPTPTIHTSFGYEHT